MIELNQTTLKKIQLVELDLLKEFDRICRKYDIKYSITGGTLLGAVRHKGFIPWDDDADVSIMREEYERFVKVCDSELDHNKYEFQDIDRTYGYRWGYGKLRRKDSLFLREFQEHMPYNQGIFMDVFPRDSVPDGVLSEKIHKFRCFVVRKILWSEVGQYAEKSRLTRKLCEIISKKTQKRVFVMYRKLVSDSQDKKTKRVRTLTFPVPNNAKGYLREWYNEYEDIMFEDYPLMVEKGFLEWLTQEFGDYMVLPPLDKRKTHPVVNIKTPETI